MIIKSTSIKDIKGIRRTVEYVFREDKDAKLIYTKYLPRKIDMGGMITSLQENEFLRLRRRKDSVILFHDFISFHSGDTESLEIENLKEIAKLYGDMRAGSINITVLHREAEHTHLHIISSGVEYGTGKSSRVSRATFNERKQLLELYQDRKLNLTFSRVDHRKKK